MIILADAHLNAERVPAFFALLDKISLSKENVLFLGDILDLWIGMTRYEVEFHQRFLAWCRNELQKRKIYFLEGNHEFFVAKNHGTFFTSAGESLVIPWGNSNAYFCHGERTAGCCFDLTRIILRVVRSRLVHFLLRWFPLGPGICRMAKKAMGHRPWMADRIPVEQIRKNADALAKKFDCALVVLGHYHRNLEIPLSGTARCLLMPAWFKDGELVLLREDGTCRILPEHWDPTTL